MKELLLGLVLSAFAVMLAVSPASAIDKCKVKVDGKTGVINVTAVGASGPVLWGESAEAANKAFFNAGTCLTGSSATGCQLADPSTLEAKTPPSGCTIYLDDGAAPCSAWIIGCTPGVRAASAPEWVPPPSPRFVDNGDGTISDRQTGLMWEKKTGDLNAYMDSPCPGGPNCADVHDVWNRYTWSTGDPWNPDGSAYGEFLATLNAGGGFAGHTDWRLPTLGELADIATHVASDRVAAGIWSPTRYDYVSSTTTSDDPHSVWSVGTYAGNSFSPGTKTSSYAVRAVRAGS